jgi:hypothetical protein
MKKDGDSLVGVSMDEVESGSNNAESIEKIFGVDEELLEAFRKSTEDEAEEELVLNTFRWYQEDSGLDIEAYEDYGWDPVYFNAEEQPELEYLREEKHKPDQLCPTNPASMDFVKELVDMYAELHPDSKYFHIGGDETRQLGICPECAEYVRKHGKGGLYTAHINKVIDYVCSKGKIPLIYDDMVCAHPEAMKDLDRRAVIVYWDYWTTTDPSPLVVSRGGGTPRGIVHDISHAKDGYAGIADLERSILNDFTDRIDMLKELPAQYLATYRKYLGEGFPRMMKAYPYLEYYKDQGFRVITMPTTMGNTDNYLGAPNQARFTANVMTCAKRTKEAGAEGMIASAWYPFPEAAYPYGIALAGQYAWGLAKDAAVTVPGGAASV